MAGVVSDYELLDEGRQGGMGVVYKARQRSLNRVVALKMILSAQPMTPAALERFHLEAKAAASLKHDNIVKIHEARDHDGQPSFSMEFSEGRD